jgi:predicted rRNA methylase YqxC with S4 and FtsJ domains
LVKRGLFGSREQAAAAIDAGRVLVAGQPAR